MAPQMGRPSVVSLWLSPRILSQRGGHRGPLSGLSPRPTLADLLSAGVGIIPPHPCGGIWDMQGFPVFSATLLKIGAATSRY